MNMELSQAYFNPENFLTLDFHYLPLKGEKSYSLDWSNLHYALPNVMLNLYLLYLLFLIKLSRLKKAKVKLQFDTT